MVDLTGTGGLQVPSNMDSAIGYLAFVRLHDFLTQQLQDKIDEFRNLNFSHLKSKLVKNYYF